MRTHEIAENVGEHILSSCVQAISFRGGLLCLVIKSVEYELRRRWWWQLSLALLLIGEFETQSSY